MNFIFILYAFFILVVFPLTVAFVLKNFGRKFWTWFWISLPLPVISLILLICLPDSTKSLLPAPVFETDEFEMYH